MSSQQIIQQNESSYAAQGQEEARMRLLQAMSEVGIAAYAVALARLWDRKDISAEERAKIPELLRREILCDTIGRDPKRVANLALERTYGALQLRRSGIRIFEGHQSDTTIG